MQIIKCEMCGGREFEKKDGYIVCQYCGTQYPDEEKKTVIVNELPQGNSIPTRCPICGEKEGWVLLENNRKGFSAGKALLGGVLFGPIGLVAGALGKKTTTFYCKRCGFQHEYKG